MKRSMSVLAAETVALSAGAAWAQAADDVVAQAKEDGIVVVYRPSVAPKDVWLFLQPSA